MVAQVRGVVFAKDPDEEGWMPSEERGYYRTEVALNDVIEELGFSGSGEYLRALEELKEGIFQSKERKKWRRENGVD